LLALFLGTQQVKVRREINNDIHRKKRRLNIKGKRKRRGNRENFRRRTGRGCRPVADSEVH
jgi:hypothetical protein